MIKSALQLATLGYAVFPCAPNQKRPATANGLLDASADAEIVEQLFAGVPSDANLALRTDGLLVVDIDGADNPWLATEPEKLLELHDAPCSQTPRGGKHFIFRAPDGLRLRNTAGKLAPKVDTRADGGYILTPPSVVEGKAYRWLTQLDCEPERLPLPPDWLLRLLDGNRRPVVAASPALNTADSGNAIPDGQRNGTLTRLAGTMRRNGMSEGEIFAAISRVNADRCRPPLDEDEVRIIAGSVSRYAPDQIATAVAEDHAGQDGIGQTERRKSVGEFPRPLLAVPGFVERVVEYNLRGAYKPQPVLALAGALSLLAVLTGRKIADPYGTRTNLYCIGIGESGCGKERARSVNKMVLHDAGLGRHEMDGIASGSGLTAAILQEPALLFQLDEIGRYLKTLTNAKQSPHLYQVITVLMKLFTSSSSVYKGDAYADAKKNVTIFQPHCCVFGTTVPRSFYEGLTAESVSDGFLSRILVFEAESEEPELQAAAMVPVPKPLVELARFWGDLRPGGNLSSETPQPIVVDVTQEAAERFAELESLARAERRAGHSTAALWTRTTEKARKLALLFACSASATEPIIGSTAANWAAEASEFLTRKLLEIAEDHIAENSVQANRKRVLKAITAAGNRGVSQSELARSLQWLKARDRQEILDVLTEAGEIRTETLTTGTAGRPRVVFLAT